MPKHYTMHNKKYIIFDEEDVEKYLPAHLQHAVRHLYSMVMLGRQTDGLPIPRLAVNDLREEQNNDGQK